ncbi:MAG: CPBP family intramembrane glutamic endopeptidase [Gemmatimonadota bacterium]
MTVAAIGVISAFVAGDRISHSLRFFAHDAKRIAWQLGFPILLVLLRPQWRDAVGLSARQLPRGLRAVCRAGPAVFAIVLGLNFAHGRYRVYDVALSVVLTNSAYYFLVNSLAEELFFRGAVQSALVHFLRSPVLGLLAASLVFGFYHIPMFGWSIADTLMPALGGLVFGFAFLRTRSIVAPWFLHGLADLALLNDTIGTYLLREVLS